MSGIPGTAVVQVTNLSSAVSSEQMRTLFGFLGDIEELRLYPPDNAPLSFSSKVCYIKYRDPSSVGVAQHLTNTVFVDRALIVVPCAEGKIPEEAKALSLLAPATPVPSLIPGGGLLPIPTPAPLQNLNLPLVNRISAGLDPTASVLSQPPLMGNVDPSKVDEIRRTVYVGNLNSQTTTAEQLLEFFKQVGDVKFVRMAGDETQPTRFAFVEFVEQESVARALTFNGVMFGDRPLKVNHSNNAIVKPPELTPQAAAKELESVMKRVREAQSTIAAAIEPDCCSHSSGHKETFLQPVEKVAPVPLAVALPFALEDTQEKVPFETQVPEQYPHSLGATATEVVAQERLPQFPTWPQEALPLPRQKAQSQSLKMYSHTAASSGRGSYRLEMCPVLNPVTVFLSGATRGGVGIDPGALGGKPDHRHRKDHDWFPLLNLSALASFRGKKDKRRERSRDRRERSTSRKRSRKDEDTKSKAKSMKVERDYEREEKEDLESDREDSVTPSEDMTSSPCAHHNGSYKTHSEEDASMVADK
ncbi:hypothetical protein L3Q82_012446 [Scortum barcoo]|uniref:Uncharacterized protein n=1 Tax=Scortum barcoo TaxID=214431 RepID=A0ACB8W312_9TELE|nr:hypothetical protein L3Q82_012446 [Scortum barcoo]